MSGRRTIPEMLIEALTTVAGGAYDLGHYGLTAPPLNRERVEADVQKIEPLVRIAERDIHAVLATTIGGAVMATLEELSLRKHLKNRKIPAKEMNAIVGVVAERVMTHMLAEEIVIHPGTGATQ